MKPRFTVYASAEAVEDAFYSALRDGNLSALMDIWADDDEVLCIHPGGRRDEGLSAVRESWAEILRGGGMSIRPTQRRSFVGAALAVHHVIEAIEIRDGNTRQIIYCQATNVFIKDPMGWRMISHHASPPGEPETQAGAAPPGGLLH